MGSFSDLTIADVVRSLGRYRPVAVTVVAIVVALLVLPKPDRPAALASATGGAGIRTPAASGASRTTVAAGADAVSGAGVADVTATTIGVESGAVSFPSFSSGSSFSPPPSGASGAEDDGSSSFGPITSGTSTVDTTNGPPSAGEPLRVVGKTWASRTGGTPLAKDGVPDGTLPVGARVSDDKISFVRLAGSGTTLGFAEDPAGARENNGPVKVQACAVTEDWQDGEAVPIQDAPAYDANKCIEGTRSAAGIWIFDLSSFADRTNARGFALRPGDGGGLDFQVAFRLG